MLERQFPEGTIILVDADDDDTVLTVNGERVGGRVELPMVGLDEPVAQGVVPLGWRRAPPAATKAPTPAAPPQAPEPVRRRPRDDGRAA